MKQRDFVITSICLVSIISIVSGCESVYKYQPKDREKIKTVAISDNIYLNVKELEMPTVSAFDILYGGAVFGLIAAHDAEIKAKELNEWSRRMEAIRQNSMSFTPELFRQSFANALSQTGRFTLIPGSMSTNADGCFLFVIHDYTWSTEPQQKSQWRPILGNEEKTTRQGNVFYARPFILVDVFLVASPPFSYVWKPYDSDSYLTFPEITDEKNHPVKWQVWSTEAKGFDAPIPVVMNENELIAVKEIVKKSYQSACDEVVSTLMKKLQKDFKK